MRLPLVALTLATLTGCTEALDPYTSDDRGEDDVPERSGERLSPEEIAAEEAASGEAPLGTPAAGAYAWDAADAHAGRVNPHRQAHASATPLKRSACLDAVARRWSRRMASGACGPEELCHRPDTGPSSLTYQVSRCWSWWKIGENVAYGGGEERMWNAFLDSPGHHHNIDDDWNKNGGGKFGVGVFRRSDGRVFVTQVFATRR